MKIETTRFGRIEADSRDLLRFPHGLFGLEDCQEWVLLKDGHADGVEWMQSTTRPEVALAVVSPRRFVPEYQARISRADLAPLGLDRTGDAQLLVIVGRNERGYTLNLKAPLVIHPDRRLGKQIITTGDLSLQYELSAEPLPMKRIA
jgi:flagellar assembly factor FliW